MKSAIVIAICRILKLSNGWMRYKLGACPECNSSAPELYDCPVCEYGKVKKLETWNRFVRAKSAIVIAAMMLAGCASPVYVHRDPRSLRVIRMERNGVPGVWMPDAWFSSISANAACMLDLMHEAEVEASQKSQH